MTTSTIAGFSLLPVSYTGTSTSATHYIYARAHAASKKKNAPDALPDGRTLFLVNVPPDATERELVMLLKGAGTVERVVFDLDKEGRGEDVDSDEEEEGDGEGNEGEVEAAAADEQPRKRRKLNKPSPPPVVPLPALPQRRLRPAGRTAHVIFLDASSLSRALASASTQNKPRVWPTSGAEDELSGLARYAALHAALRPPLDTVRAHADSAMALFEWELARSKRAAASKYRKGEAIVDEDGFTLVTRGGAYGQTLGGGVAVASKVFQETSKKKKEEKRKDGFYAFQKAEKQRNELMELKKNWEADKAKVEKLKASRRFKPY